MKQLSIIFATVLLLCGVAHAQTWSPQPLLTTAQQAAGLSGGEANQWAKVFEYDPTNASNVWAGIDTSQIWKSTDGGTTWTHKSKGLYAKGIKGIAVSPNDSNIVCVATHWYGVSISTRPTYTTGIYRTTDGGDNWSLAKDVDTGYNHPRKAGDIIQWAGTSSTLYCGTIGYGILKSADSGATWTNIKEASGTHTFSGMKVVDVKVSPVDNDTIFCTIVDGTTSTGLHKITTNGSVTVSSRSYLSASKSGTSYAWKSFVYGTGTIYISRLNGDTRGIYRSTDGGTTFSSINGGITDLASWDCDYFEVAKTNQDKAAFTQSSASGSRYGNVSYWYCNNLGSSTPSWSNPTSVDTQNGTGWVTGSIASENAAVMEGGRPTAFSSSNPSTMLTCTQFDVISKSTNSGSTFSYSNEGYQGVTRGVAPSLNDNTMFAWDALNVNRYLICGADYGARITTDGVTFRPLSISLSGFYAPVSGNRGVLCGAIEPGGNSVIIAVGAAGAQNLQRSTNTGSTTPTFAVVNSTLRSYDCIFFNGSDTSIVYARNQKSTDKGVTWGTITSSRKVSAVHPTNGNIVYDCVYGNPVTIYRSSDAGATWSSPFATVPLVAGQTHGQFTVDPNDINRCYLTIRPTGIYIIGTGSATLATSGLTDSIRTDSTNYDFVNLCVDPFDQNILYSAANSDYAGVQGVGVFKSTDKGVTWSNYNGNLAQQNYNGISVNPINGKVYVNSFAGTFVLSESVQIGTPTATTGTATSVVATTATLNGTVDPNNGTTTCRFQYGTVPAIYTINTGSQTVNAGSSSATAVTQAITGLVASTTYYTRLQVNNSIGSDNGDETTFTTSAAGGGNDPAMPTDAGSSTLTLISSMKLLLRLDENTGSSTIDATGNCPPGSISGNISWVNGTSGSGLNFTGTTSAIVTLGTPTALTFGGVNQTYGLMADVKIGTTTGEITIISKWNSGANLRQYSLAVNTNKAIIRQSSTGVDSYSISGTSTFGITNWHNLCGLSNDVNLSIIVDRITEDNFGLSLGLYNGSSPVQLGVRGATDPFLGIMDNIRIFNPFPTTQDITDCTTWPFVTNGTASTIYGGWATVSATATAYGTTANAYVKYGTSSGNYATTTVERYIGTDSTAVSFTRTIGTLTANTTYYYQTVCENTAGNRVFGVEQSFTTTSGYSVDIANPAGTVTVNSGGTYTTSLAVTLNLSATDDIGVTGYYLSTGTTTPGIADSGWVTFGTVTPYSADVPYTLSSGDGTKTVYVWYRDGAGNLSAIASDLIILDMTFPSISRTIPITTCKNGTGTPAFGTASSTITISGSSTDTNGIASIVVSSGATTTAYTATGTQSFSMTGGTITSGVENIFSFTAQATAGNQGTVTISVGEFPNVATDYATLITKNSVTLNGTVSVNDGNTVTAYYEYGIVSGFYEGSTTVSSLAPSTVNTGLILHAKLNEASGSATNSVGTKTGTVVGALRSRQGVLSTSYGFDGVDDKVAFGTSTVFALTSSMTLSSWMNGSNSVNSTTARKLIDKMGNPGNRGYGLYWVKDAQQSITIQISSGSSTVITESENITNIHNGWHMIAGVYNASAATLGLYLDGILQGTASTGISTSQYSNNNIEVTLGYGLNTSSYFIGYLDNACIYNRALSATEVSTLYNEGLSGRTLPVAISLGALSPSTTYYYRVVATSDTGTVYGEEFNFDTLVGNSVNTNGQFHNMDMKYPGSTKFNVFLKINGIYPGRFWARNAGTQAGIDLRADPDTVLSNFKDNQ